MIFGDLTDVPVDSDCDDQAFKAHSVFSPHQQAWNFIEKVLGMAFSILKPHTGRYYTHCNGRSVPIILKKYEDMLDNFNVMKKNDENHYKVIWTKSETFVPSFMEVWVFYQIRLELANSSE